MAQTPLGRRVPVCLATAFLLAISATASAQTTFTVTSEASLRSALASAIGGDTIVFGSSITLTSGDLPSIQTSIAIDGAGHTLSGNNQFRGLAVAAFGAGAPVSAPVTVTIQNLTIANTIASGGAGGSGLTGGGGGAGLGGALFVASQADVTLINVSVNASQALGGNGGAGAVAGSSSGGGGGGMGGAGGAAPTFDAGGGGGFGQTAAGGQSTGGGPGVLSGTSPGGASGGTAGGVLGGGGGSSGNGGGGGGASGAAANNGLGGSGGFGGGGGGATDGVGGFGGFGGGGGGASGSSGGFGGFGGGGGGGEDGGPGLGGSYGGDGDGVHGGGGAGLGGAIFVDNGGALTIAGTFTINGNAVAPGAGAVTAGSGSAFGNGLFLAGSGTITFDIAAGATGAVTNEIVDEAGVLGPLADVGRWSLRKDGDGTLELNTANAYAGGTSVINGTLSVLNRDSIGTGAIALHNNSTLSVATSTNFFQDLFLLNAPRIAVATGQTVTWSGDIQDNDGTGSLEVTGGGTLQLTAANSYSGGTSVNGNSTVRIGNDAALGLASGAVTLGDAFSGGTLAIDANAPFSSTRSIVFSAGGGTIDVAGVTSATLSGALSGSGAFTKTGTGTLVLAGANTYTGPTTVNAGVLRAGATNVFGVSSALTIGAAATVDLNNFNQSVGSLAGAGNVTFGSGTLTTGSNNATTLFAGVMSGSGGLIKIGSGTLFVTGANTYSGGTLVNGGALVGNTISLQGGIGNNALVVFDQNFNGTYAGIMTGTGTLAKTGVGTLFLTAPNSYSGGTIVSGNGAIAIGADAGLGAASSSVTLGDAATSGGIAFAPGASFSALRPFSLGGGGGIFDTASGANITLTGAISGSGGLTKAGAGTLTLSGANSYTGPTNITAGVLSAGAENVFGVPGLVNVGGGAALDLAGFDQTIGAIAGNGNITLGSATLTTGVGDTSSLFAGAISGTGSLTKVGAGTLVLTGSNDYSGGTDVLGGTLAGTTASLQGNITNNAAVVFDQSFNGTYAGSMTGTGALAKFGSGTLTLTGSNDYTGGTFIEGGSLVGNSGSLRGTIINNASLTFDASSDTTFNGILGGIGNVTKTGAGTLSLFGANPLTGTLTVASGTLALNGVLGGNASILAGAAMRANGAIAGSVDVAGSLFVTPPLSSPFSIVPASLSASAPNDPLTGQPYLTIGGDLTTGNGSIFGLPVAPGPNPTVLVGGRATLTGTQLNFTADVPPDQRSTPMLALTALNGLTMTNTTAVTQSPNLVPLLKQDRNSLFVMLLNFAIPLSEEVTTPNAISVGEAIDRLKPDATGDRADVIRELTALDDDALDVALESIAGEMHASAVQLAVLESDRFTDIIRDQLTARAHDAAEQEADGWGGQKIRWWSQLTGEYASFDANGTSRGAIARFGSGAGGMDYRLSDRWLFGAGGGFGAGNMGMRGISGDTDFRAPRAFGYVGYKPRGFGIRGGASTSRVSYKKNRRLAFAATLPAEFGIGLLTGGVDREAESEEAGLVSDTWSEYDDSVGIRTYVLDFMVGLRQARFSRGGFTESAASLGALALTAPEQVLTLRHTDVKLHLWRKRGTYRPYVETMFRRELTDGETDLTLQFADEPDSDFTVEGVPIPGNMFAGRAGVTMMMRLGAVTFEYAIRKASGQTRQTADIRVRFK